MAADFQKIMQDLKGRKFKPVYMLQGDEPYYIDKISDYIEQNALTEGERSFNQTVVYGKDLDHLTLLDMLRRYPMMSEFQVVVLKEAQQMKTLDNLESYIANPLVSTIFVICYKYKKLDKRTTFFKALSKSAVIFDSLKIKDYQLTGWISQQVSANGYNIKPKAVQLLADYLGNDLSKIENELEKLFLNVQPTVTIGAEEIEKNIGISKDYNVFEFQNALGTRDHLKAFRIVKNFAANMSANPLIVTLTILYGYFSKVYLLHFCKGSDNDLAKLLGVNPFFMKDYNLARNNYSKPKLEEVMALLHEYDLRSKGVGSHGAEHSELLRELTYKIMN